MKPINSIIPCRVGQVHLSFEIYNYIFCILEGNEPISEGWRDMF